MYKLPELSRQAKLLKAALQKRGFSQTMAQCQELLAAAQGEQTLHVAQARKAKQGLELSKVACKQAAAVMFKSLGEYADRIESLWSTLESALALESSSGSRAVEAALVPLLESENPVVVRAPYDMLTVKEWKSAYNALVAQLEESLQEQTGANPTENPDQVLADCVVMDWRVQEGEPLAELPEHHRRAYKAKIQQQHSQFYVDLESQNEEDGPALSLFVEINEGLPCVHITHSLYADMDLSVFSTPDGLYLRSGDLTKQLSCAQRVQSPWVAQLKKDFSVYSEYDASHDWVIEADSN